ncbi:MAG TPA: Rne/Rng family ribonuclease [Xanthobacteraceae bacterium]|nr:Rne/Rng family ribonuclease [Xanthobacteraceae bacterium]
MANKMLIDATHPEETRVVVLRGNRVEEFDFESAQRQPLRGNIYLAKVTRVEPSLQAAFVEYGGNRHGFLAFSEIHPDYYQIPVADRQALLEEEQRAHRDADDEEERRPRGRRSRNSNRSRDTVRSEVVEITETGDAGGDGSPEAAGTLHAEGGETAGHDPDFVTAQTAATHDDNDNGAGERPAEDPAATGTDLAQPIAALSDEPAVSEAGEPATGELPFEAEARAPEQDTTAHVDAPQHAATGDDDSDDTAEDHDHDLYAANADENGQDADHLDADNHDDDSHDADETDGEDGDSAETIESVGGDDALDETAERAPRYRKQYKIQEVIKRRQVMLVQVVKEERGSKGAALTTYLSLAGRYSVLMPNTARGGGISRKITDSTDRRRLKEIAQELEVPEGMGVILRTAGASRTKTEVKRDFEYLLRVWETVRDLTLHSTAPCLVYEEGSLIKRSIRDLYNKEIDDIVVAGADAYREAKDFMRMLMPSHTRNVKLYRDPQPLLTRYGVESQLDAMFSPVVQLKSGGYLVLNQTEALVAIDVNSGRSTREHHIEDTALKTNLEAAEEVARQLRLRDLAGLIVIDFIDMDEKRNNRAVERKVKECLKNDRARIQVGHISHFGLLEMSRQRIRSSVLESSTDKCPHCGGSGHVRSVSSVALQLIRMVEESLLKNGTHNLNVRTRTDIAIYVLNHKRAHLRVLEERFRITITISADETVTVAQPFVIERGEQVHSVEQARAIASQQTGLPVLEEDEDEPAFEEADTEDDAEAEVAEDAGDDESGETEVRERGEDGERPARRRRRRGRRNRNGSDDPRADGDETPDGTEETADGMEAAAAGTSGSETEENGDSGSSEAASGENGDRDEDGRRRRRGRRGGRRNRRDRGAPNSEQAASEAGQDDGDDGEAAPDAVPFSPVAGNDDNAGDVPAPAPETATPVTATAEPAEPAADIRPAAPAASVEDNPPAPVEAAPRRRSTVREAVPVFSGSVTTSAQPAAAPVATLSDEPVTAPAETAASDDEAPTPRRAGWWSRKVFGKG